MVVEVVVVKVVVVKVAFEVVVRFRRARLSNTTLRRTWWASIKFRME